MSPSPHLDAERRAAAAGRLPDPTDHDPLYLLIAEHLRRRGVLAWTLKWPEIDVAIREAVKEWRRERAAGH